MATSCVFPMHMYVKDLVVIDLEIIPHGQPELQVFVTVIFPVTDAVTNCNTGNRNTELFKIIFWLLLNTSGVLLFVLVCFFEVKLLGTSVVECHSVPAWWRVHKHLHLFQIWLPMTQQSTWFWETPVSVTTMSRIPWQGEVNLFCSKSDPLGFLTL